MDVIILVYPSWYCEQNTYYIIHDFSYVTLPKNKLDMNSEIIIDDLLMTSKSKSLYIK